MLAYCNLAWVEWFLGYPDCALDHSQTAIDLSEHPEPHSHSLAFALSLGASLHQFRGEPEIARRHAETVIDLAEQHHFAYWGPWGHVLRGWARAMTDEKAAGLAEIQSGIQAYRETGAGLMRPYFLGLQAEALQRVGHWGDGLAAVNEALELSEANHIRFYEPELYCLRAELLGSSDALAEERVACLREALAKAEAQSSRAFVVRALTVLSKELSDPQERSWTLDKLREILAEYGRGQAIKLLIDAQAIVNSARS